MKRKGVIIGSIGIFCFLILVLSMFSLSDENDSGNSSISSTDDNKVAQKVSIKGVDFIVRNYNIFSEKEASKQNMVVEIKVTNNREETVYLDKNDFLLERNFDNYYINQDYSDFLSTYDLQPKQSVELLLLYKVPIDIDFDDVSMEIDLSVETRGKNVYFNSVPCKIYESSLEEYICELNNIDKEHSALICGLLKKEEIKLYEIKNMGYDANLNEHEYFVSGKYNVYALFVNELGSISMYDISNGSSIYPIYEDGVRNKYYYSDGFLWGKSDTFMNALEKTITSIYKNSKIISKERARVADQENAICVTMVVEGQNAFGATLIKTCKTFADWNPLTEQFDIYYQTFESTIDKRITVSFDTGCDVTINDVKVSKNYYIKDYSYLLKKEGYKFVGWKIKNTNTYYDFSYILSKDFVLVAQWEKV